MQRMMLLGRDHDEYGKITVERLGPVAIALSRGRHPKAYPYTDPNEDTVVAAVDGDSVLMAVADGHHGIQASHLAAETLYQSSSELVALPPSEAVTEAVRQVGAALAAASVLGEVRSATTFTVVAVRGEEGAALGWGDSAAVHLPRRKAKSLLPQRPEFVGLGESMPDPGPPTRFQVQAGDLVVLATDGLTDFVVQPWPKTLATMLHSLQEPDDVAETSVATAGEGGGGDNVAVAALSTRP